MSAKDGTSIGGVMRWFFRIQLPAMIRAFWGEADLVNRQAKIAQRLFNVANGKREIPTREECFQWANELSQPGWWRDEQARKRDS